MLPFKKKAQKSNSVIGLDIGSGQLKAVGLCRKEGAVAITHFAVVPCVVTFGKEGIQKRLAEVVQDVLASWKMTGRRLSVAMSTSSALVGQVEMPQIPLDEARSALKLNGVRYLRHDLNEYYFDLAVLADSASEAKGRKSSMMQLLVAGAPKAEVVWVRDALVNAKLKVDSIELVALTVINALQRSHGQICEQELVLLLDVGAQITTLNFLRQGQPLLTRFMQFGGTALTEHIAKILTLSTAAAEEEKRKMSESVSVLARAALQPLVREVRSSIDFVERQYDCRITHAFVGGGTACRSALVQFLGEDVGLGMEVWNPLEGMKMTELNGDVEQLKSLAPSLGGAVGAAIAYL
jgi:type IV pilus assembly protein PilM